jgi:hypothetical protein
MLTMQHPWENRRRSVLTAILAPYLVAAAMGQETRKDGDPLPILPQNIAATVATLRPAEVEVVGQPRTTKGHPCTLWDQEDVAQLKKLLATSPGLQAEFVRLKQQMDQLKLNSLQPQSTCRETAQPACQLCR